MDPDCAEVLASELDSLDVGNLISHKPSGSPARDKLTLAVGRNASVEGTDGCDPNVQSDWVLLDCCYGIPLFQADVNREVCERVASHLLCSKDRYFGKSARNIPRLLSALFSLFISSINTIVFLSVCKNCCIRAEDLFYNFWTS